MSLKSYLFLIVLCASSFCVSSQQKNASSFSWDQMRYGGRIGLEFSNNITSFTLSPAAIYQFSEEFAAGSTVSFGYTNYKNADSHLFNYGASILGIYTPMEQIQISAELEQVFVSQKYDQYYENYNYQALFLGAGYRMKNVVVGLRYDVLYNEEKNLYASPYAPFVQVFF